MRPSFRVLARATVVPRTRAIPQTKALGRPTPFNGGLGGLAQTARAVEQFEFWVSVGRLPPPGSATGQNQLSLKTLSMGARRSPAKPISLGAAVQEFTHYEGFRLALPWRAVPGPSAAPLPGRVAPPLTHAPTEFQDRIPSAARPRERRTKLPLTRYSRGLACAPLTLRPT